MKLSIAMMLGRVTCKMVAANWNSCALGSAANALGMRKHGKSFDRTSGILKAWPWLEGKCPESLRIQSTDDFMDSIRQRFDYHVCDGQMTFEQLVDWVAAIEPECGECCRFECTCVKTESNEAVEVLQENQ